MQPTTLDNLINAVHGQAVGVTGGAVFHRIQTDSRKVQPGDVFWPLCGQRFDGHNFVTQAFENGAIASVVSRHHAKCTGSQKSTILVSDTNQALQNFARWHRQRWGKPVIGVTGSCGKTTTREAIHSVLSTVMTGCQSHSNNNNHFGVPYTLLNIRPDDQFAVVECGASALGEMQDLVSCCQPTIGVITGVSNSHLEGFQSLQGIYTEKTRMVSSLKSDELAIVAGDNRKLRSLVEKLSCRTLYVGENSDNHVQIESVRLNNEQTEFQVGKETFCVPLAGKHNAQAAAIAVAIGREFGLSTNAIREGLLNIEPIPGRCQVERFGGWTVINDTYNASPTSTLAACRLLRDWDAPFSAQKHLVLGDMLELGDRSAAFHQKLGRQIAASGIDQLHTYGVDAEYIVAGAVEEGFPSMRTNASNSLTELCKQLAGSLSQNDVVLVKGSRGMRMERVVEFLRYQFLCSNLNLAKAA
ncbi:UDP-N-acetylmuramoyl-tripeptide--D-alanyl-D-alanine ligase [Thalassoroseus pseudoceratinae]|uniref:UDP-N-acetylmuramoyl-tripeptide--D-alanyl-D- alanine ligase n=1 Tax=Thalassoroseus pseudoceratinae TaxID=2713176 RepID=UPI0014201B64|nr:UDP-N-acetylmuramoyl-tripeptide--D-alanyl-D-alanine ligase [Thalassoroseus pseudoceratinae]